MIRLQAMSKLEFQAFTARCMRDYAEEVSRVDDVPMDQAETKAKETIRGLLPNGWPGATDQYLYTALDEAGQPVGGVWFGIRRDRPRAYAYLWDLYLEPAARGRGHGERIMRQVEVRVRELGHDRIELNVFGHNAPARRLYERLGYQATWITMGKDL